MPTLNNRVSRKLSALAVRDPELQPYLERLAAIAPAPAPNGGDTVAALQPTSRFVRRRGFFVLGDLTICQTFHVSYRLRTDYGVAGLLNWRRESGDRSRAWFYEVLLEAPAGQIAHRLSVHGLEVSTLPAAQDALPELLREKFATLGVARNLSRKRAEEIFSELRIGLPERAVFAGEGR